MLEGEQGLPDGWTVLGAEDQAAADIINPFVPDGCGQPKGLSKKEQIAWQLQQAHPFALERVDLPEDLHAALAFECATPTHEIDRFRASVVQRWKRRAEELRECQKRCVEGAHPHLRQLVAGIHGPLELCATAEFLDTRVVRDVQQGFPYVDLFRNRTRLSRMRYPGHSAA